MWDLRYDPPHRVALRTLAPDNPHIWEEPRFAGKDTRPIVHWGIEQAMVVGPIAAPGKYTVRMRAKDQTLTRPIELLKDPAIPSPDADLVASTKTQARVRDDMNAAADMINRLEVLRKQVEDQQKTAKKPAAVKLLDGIGQKLMNAELLLLSRTDMHSDDKWYVERYKVFMNLIWINGEIGTGAGDVAGGADYKPTDASLEVLDGIEKDSGRREGGLRDGDRHGCAGVQQAGAFRRTFSARRAALSGPRPRPVSGGPFNLGRLGLGYRRAGRSGPPSTYRFISRAVVGRAIRAGGLSI